MEFTQDEDASKALIKILMIMSSASDSSQELIIDNCCNHKNSRYFIDMLLQVLNRGSGEVLDSCLDCLYLLFSDERTQEGLFYTNDFRVLVDIFVQNLENLSEHKLLLHFLDVLVLIVESSDFQRLKHRAQDIWEACNNLSTVPQLTAKADIVKNRIRH